MKITRHLSSRRITRVCTLMLAFASFTATAQQSESGNTPRIINFSAAERLQAGNALSILTERLHLNSASDELRSAYIEQPGDGLQVQRFNQYFKGIRVAHGTFTLTSKNGIATYAFGQFYNIPTATSTTPVLSEGEALNKALTFIGAAKYMWEGQASGAPKAELQYVQDFSKEPLDGIQHLAYAFDIYAEEPLSRNMVYVDAQSGKILFKDAILKHVNATGQSLYSDTVSFKAGKVGSQFYLHDSTRGGGIFTYNLNHGTNTNGTASNPVRQDSSSTNFFAQDPAIDAHWGAEMVYDYWKNTHNRLSWNGTNGALKSYVHYSNSYNNAMWNGAAMVYGDGSGVASGGMNPLTTLDICGHEIGHGVCQSTANLAYNGESGAMNEGFSDIWGTVIETYGDPHEVDARAKDKWLMGEETGLILRSMKNPKTYQQPNTYQGAYWVYTGPNCGATTTDNCGVHTNSGVLNYWFYLLCEGDKGVNDLGNNFKVIPVGMTKAAKIAYAAELALTQLSNYAACRTASIAAATTLYGACSPEVEAVTRAWYAVGVGSNYTPCTPQVSFSDVSSSVSEDAFANVCNPSHLVSVPVVLNGASLAGDSAIVTAAVIGGTAVAGIDYALTTPSVTFTVGGATSKSILLTVYDNGTVNANKYVDLVYTLSAGASNLSRSAVLDTTRIFISNDDNNPDVGGIELHTALTYSAPVNLGSPLMSNAISARAQYIYKPSELLAAGIRPNVPITQAEFFVSAKNSTQPFSGYTVQMGNTNLDNLTGGFVSTALTTVYSSSLTTSVGWNAIPFTAPFVWNGTDNVVMEVYFTNTTRDANNDRVQAQMGSYTLAAYATSTSGASGASLPFNVNNLCGFRPVIRFTQNVPPTPIATALNANRVWELKNNQQIYFYSDTASGKKLIAAVLNPTTDFGCVTTTVTASGNGFVFGANGKARSVKEFSIATANNIAAPHYDAIVYMTTAELANIDPNRLQITRTTATTDAQMNASNTEVVTPNDMIIGQDYVGFRGSFTGFGRFFLGGDNIGLAVGNLSNANGTLWTGANPFRTNPELHWSLANSEHVSLRVYDITGKVIYASETTLAPGTHQLILAGANDYAPGTYILQVVRPTGVFTSQMIKQ